MTAQVSSGQSVKVKVKAISSPRLQIFAALLFGMVIFYAVGFSPIGIAHNAAHDARHSLAFPCH
jgi:cobalt transporter subunit CbtB